MQVCISTRDCRVAIGAALVALETQLKQKVEEFRQSSYNALYEGAVHNGTLVNDALKQEMREMVERDVEHALKGRNPMQEQIDVLKNYIDLMAYHKGEEILLDDQDFALLKAHLPTGEAAAEEVAA